MNVVDAFDKFDYFRGFFLESIAISYLEDGKINCHVSLRRGGEYSEDYSLDVPKVANITVSDVSSYRLYQKPRIMRLPILTGVHLVDMMEKWVLTLEIYRVNPRMLRDFYRQSYFSLEDILTYK